MSINRGITLATVAVVLAGAFSVPVAGQTTGPKTRPLVIESLVGRDLFMFYCASCHGRNGRGDGPIAPSLKTPPADLTRIAARNGGRFPTQRVKDVIAGNTVQPTPAHGQTDMPVWGPIFLFLDPDDARTTVRIENLATYLESIQSN